MTTELNSRTFPVGFLWGAAIGSHQSEGNNVASDWWDSRERGRSRRSLSAAGDAIDSYHRWREDLDLRHAAGLTDYRFGIEWSSIEPSRRSDLPRRGRTLPTNRRGRDRASACVRWSHCTTSRIRSGSPRAADGCGRMRCERFLRYVDALAPVLDAGLSESRPSTSRMWSRFSRNSRVRRISRKGFRSRIETITNAMIEVHQAVRDRLHRDHLGCWSAGASRFRITRPEPGAEGSARRVQPTRATRCSLRRPTAMTGSGSRPTRGPGSASTVTRSSPARRGPHSDWLGVLSVGARWGGSPCRARSSAICRLLSPRTVSASRTTSAE